MATTSICCSVSSGVVGVLCLIFGVIVTFLSDPLINHFIDKELVIKNDTNSTQFKFWSEPPIKPYIRFYFFNMTNSKEFLEFKVRPAFQEVGPYSYREKWKKINIRFHDNGTVSYETRKFYYFDLDQSSGPQSDVVHTLNVPVIAAIERIAGMGRLAQLAFDSMLTVLNETTFVNKTVEQLLWGYSDPLLDFAKKYLPPSQNLPFDKFGFFYQRNGSTDGALNVYTGSLDMDTYMDINTFNLSRLLPYWGADACNRLNGTDGTAFPPRIGKADTLYLFNDNLCRSLPLTYNNTLLHQDIEAYRFTPPADTFSNATVNPANACFCNDLDPSSCISGGVFNVKACKFNVSTILSWPHFYQADPKYLDAVVGLKPDGDKHSLYVDVNPTLGVPMAAQARIQVNLLTQQLPTISLVSNMTPMVFPLIWFEDGISSLPPNITSIIKLATTVPKIVKMSLLSIFFALGACLVALALILQTCQKSQRTTSSGDAEVVCVAAKSCDVSSRSRTDSRVRLAQENDDDGEGISNPALEYPD